VRSFKSMRLEVAVVVAKTIFLSDMRSVLGEVTTPCTIVQVRNDIAVPVAVGSFMKSKIKGKASLVVMDADGHFPQLTAPTMLLDILDREILVTRKD
ncbi:alpha/beta fold hydrolase, partial [Acinetobacter baumannii]|uniref:alpha/beta fold hydrolase n=1 Tax=Acinetobacter baumannii TaxID=470 RepID=UPI003EC10DCC